MTDPNYAVVYPIQGCCESHYPTLVPRQLQGRISPADYQKAIDQINFVLMEAQSNICCQIIAGLCCICGGLCYLIQKQQELLRNMNEVIEKVNREIFRPNGMACIWIRYTEGYGDNRRTVQYLRIEIIQVQDNKGEIVQCPTCRTQLAVPSNAPTFQCPTCKTILQAPSKQPLMATPIFSSPPIQQTQQSSIPMTTVTPQQSYQPVQPQQSYQPVQQQQQQYSPPPTYYSGPYTQSSGPPPYNQSSYAPFGSAPSGEKMS